MLYRKNRKRELGYLIRLTREYTDGGMDSRADVNSGVAIAMHNARRIQN